MSELLSPWPPAASAATGGQRVPPASQIGVAVDTFADSAGVDAKATVDVSATADAVTLAVLDAFMAYEQALMRNDVAAMDAFFLDSTSVVRFGVAEEQLGIDEVRAWRAGATPVPAGRRLSATQVALHGSGTAIVTTLFRYPDGTRLGRQTQVWVNPDGDPQSAQQRESWRIASAHVSERSEDAS